MTVTADIAAAPEVSAATLATRADSHASFGEVFRVIIRAFRYVSPFKWRFFGKWWFNAIGLIPVMYVPWPGKLLLDNVVQGDPITAETVSKFPPYLQWAVALLVGKSPVEIAVAVIGVGFVTLILFGLFGQGALSQNTIGGRDQSADATTGTRTNMGEGSDTAANSENAANYGSSWASGLYGLFEYRFQMRLTQAVNHFFRADLFQKIKALPMTSIEDRRAGDMIYRVMYDTPMITGLVYDILLTPMALGTFGMLLYVMNFSYGEAPEVIWIALLMVPVGFILTAPFSAFVRRRSAASRIAGAVTTHTIEENLSNVFAVQSLGGWKRELRRFEMASEESFRRYRGVIFASILITVVAGLGTLALSQLLTFVVAGKIIEGKYTIGDYGVLLFNYAYMSGSMAVLSQLWIRIQDNVVGVRRVFALMDLVAESDVGTMALPPVKQGVKAEGVTLIYPDGRQALDGVDFEAKVGEITAIVGPTGAGKTTLAYLVPRFHGATTGRVTIDGLDVKDLTLQSLRDQVTYVFQDTQLFSGSVAENICYGAPGATMDEIRRAARISGVDQFIEGLPEGYETQLGARGAKLSVGQKQRIAIARGLICHSTILILDEPTSALDPETETYLVDALHEAAKGKAVIIIAHRLSTIAHADKVVFLQDGKVIESGRPSDLVGKPGSAYGAFVRLQTQ